MVSDRRGMSTAPPSPCRRGRSIVSAASELPAPHTTSRRRVHLSANQPSPVSPTPTPPLAATAPPRPASAQPQVKYSYDPDASVECSKARGSHLRVHFKACREVTNTIKGMKLAKAKDFLEKVLNFEAAVPFTMFTGELGCHTTPRRVPRSVGHGLLGAGRMRGAAVRAPVPFKSAGGAERGRRRRGGGCGEGAATRRMGTRMRTRTRTRAMTLLQPWLTWVGEHEAASCRRHAGKARFTAPLGLCV